MAVIKWVGAIVALLAVAVIVVGVGMYFRLIPIPGPILALLVGAKPPEYSARYYPPDTLAYAWLTLVPGQGQFEDVQDIWGRFNEYPAFRDLVDELQEEFESDTGINFEEDVLPWIGPEMAAAIIEIDGIGSNISTPAWATIAPGAAIIEIDGIGSNGVALDDGIEAWDAVTIAGTISVRDKDAANDFLTKWRAFMTQESDADFSWGSYRDFDTWVDESKYQSYALTDDWLVFATDEKTLTAMLDRIEDDDADDSLADNPNFTAAQAALPERRFSSFYLDYRQGLALFEEAIGGALGPLMPGIVGPAAFAEQAPDWVAGSTGWVERGVTVEVVSPTVSTFGLDTVELQDPANLLPADTLGFMAGAFDPDVDHWRTALREYDLADLLPYPDLIDEINAGVAEMASGNPPELQPNDTLAEALDLGFWLVQDFSGIDLEADFFDHLSGQAILAVRDFDFDAVADDPAANAIDAVAMLSYREDGKDGLADTMDEVAGLLEIYVGMSANPVDVGADDDATVFDLGLLGMAIGSNVGYQPGYVLHDQYLTIGTTQDALATIVERQNGEGDALSSDTEYRRAVANLAAGGQFLGYVDVRRIIGQLKAEDLDLEPEEYRILQEGLGVVAFNSAVGEDYNRGTVVLTLFPE